VVFGVWLPLCALLGALVLELGVWVRAGDILRVESVDGTGAAEGTTNNITSVIQTVLAAQLVTKSGLIPDDK
jgi:hypothetical protein